MHFVENWLFHEDQFHIECIFDKESVMSEHLRPTERTKLRRLPKRGSFDRETIYRILDESYICHVGFVIDGQPFVIPTAYARVEDQLLIHGSSVSRMLRALAGEIEVCVTVTLLDGLVLARSAFHHSMNYRSVVVFGKASVVPDEAAKLDALRAFTEHIIRGRWADVRPPTPNELNATMVLRLPLTEASAKIRTGPPVDDDEDYELKVWAGELPLRLVVGAPLPDPRLPGGIIPPEYLRQDEHGRNKSSIQVRMAAPDDAARIASVLAESFVEHESAYTPEAYAATVLDSEQVLSRLREGPVWVAVREGEVVGTVSAIPKGDALYIRGMAVLPQARGDQTGKLLLKSIESFAAGHGYGRLVLSTTPFLDRAIRLYENFGFRRSNAGPHDLFGTALFTMEKTMRVSNSIND
jgi:hypothetical protein